MANRKTQDHILRKVFDGVYHEVDALQHVDTDKLKHQIDKAARVNRRIMGMSLVVIAIAIFLIAFVYGTQALVNHAAWVNRPSFAERLLAPYSLETKLPPSLENAVTVDGEVEKLMTLKAANIQTYKPEEEPIASQLLSKVVQIQSIVPAQIGDFTLEWSRVQSTLIAQCVLLTGASEQSGCQSPHMAEFVEPANFVDSKGNTISLVMTKFANEEQATATIDSIYDYARGIGHIGNFSFSDLHNVDYFYNVTRKVTSFTWLNQNWVISISANKMSTIDMFMESFPLYANNPDLANFPVVQITQTQNTTPVVEAEVEAEATETVEISDAVSGTE